MSKFTRPAIRQILGEACTDEIENALIALYLGATDPMKDEVQRYKADSEKLVTVQKELDELKAAKESGADYQKQYNDLKKQYDALEKSVNDGKALDAKKAAYKVLCQEAGLSEKGIEKALKYADFGRIELADDGKIKDAENVTKGVKDEWADYVQTERKHGAGTEHPPKGSGTDDDKPSRAAEIVAKRRAELYGVKKED